MNNTSLLVHTLNNNVENIEILLEEENLDKELNSMVGKIINDQLNKVLENAELYYLEDERFAINKEKILCLEFINYVRDRIINEGNDLTIKMNYRNKPINIDLELLKKILNYLLVAENNDIEDLQLRIIDEELKINFKKNNEHSLQNM